jgi:hypothetical protein
LRDLHCLHRRSKLLDVGTDIVEGVL